MVWAFQKKSIKNKIFLRFFGFNGSGALPLFDHFFLNVPKNRPKIFKKWYLGCFLKILKIIIYLDMLFMNFKKGFGCAPTDLFG